MQPTRVRVPDPGVGAAGAVRRILGNLGFLLSGRAVAGVLSLVYMMIAARALGPSDYGVLVLVHAYVVAVGAILGFPAWHAVVRYGAGPLAGANATQLIRLLRFTAAVELAAGAVSIVIAAALAPWLGARLGWSAEMQALAVPYSFALLAGVRTTPAGFLQLVRRFDLLAAHSAVAPMVRLLGAALAALGGWGLKAFLVAWLAAALAEWASLWIIGGVIARRHLQGQSLLGAPSNLGREIPGVWRFMLVANADATFGDLAARIAPLMVGWVLGPAAAGLFAIAQRATVVLAQPAQVLGQAAYSELAKLVAAGEPPRLLRRALARCGALALLSAAPVLITLAFLSREIVTVLGGQAFADASAVMIWLALARTTALMAPPCSAALIAMGRPGLTMIANAGVSACLLPLLPPLVIRFGLVGAGAQALLQAVVTTALLALFVWRASPGSRRPTELSPQCIEELEITAVETAETLGLS